MELIQKTEDLKSATIEAPDGLSVAILSLGAAIASIKVPTQSGPVDAILSYPNVRDYLDDRYFLGSTVGPYANRIGNGRFALGGREYSLQRNETSTGHCLHSGESGLHRQYFDMHYERDDARVTCRTVLPDGVGGFPGRREIIVTYKLVNDLCLAIGFQAITDRNTVISLANHAYFNLGGRVGELEIKVNSDTYTPVDESNLPTGEARRVAGSSFDLRTPTRIGDRVFDHNFALNRRGDELQRAATLRNPLNNLQLDLYTTQPGLQVYTGDDLATPFASREGLCLEAQGFPDAPNQPSFPSAHLAAGDSYRQLTAYKFSALTS
ncbi:MAG: aldose epimerase family protein [Woeseiaceae bacterium]|nr:aldose epimerase family protein [Woeseiaceae bacterium]